MRHWWLSGVVVALLACAPRARTPAPTSAATTPARTTAAEPDRVRAEQPLTPARLMLLNDSALAFDNWRFGREPVFPLEAGAVGYIDERHTRNVATLNEVRRIEAPRNLLEGCVAKNGRTSFFRTVTELLRGETFDGPLVSIGQNPTAVGNGVGPHALRWVVQAEAGSLLADCAAGTVERIGPPARTLVSAHWSDHIQVLRLHGASGLPPRCVLRTSETGRFVELDNCYVRPRSDGSIVVEKEPPATKRRLPNTKPPPRICLQLLDSNGTRLPCNTAPGPEQPGPHSLLKARLSLDPARYYARERALTAGNDEGLFLLDLNSNLDATRRLGSDALGKCWPLLATAPVFACAGDGTEDIVVSVNAEGGLREELRRPRSTSQYADDRTKTVFHATNDGGLAVGGDCQGNLGNVACVRARDGTWRPVPFSNELVKALNRTAPATRLVPDPEGRLYVGTATLHEAVDPTAMERAIDVSILIFRAEHGPATSVPKLPAWILRELAVVVEQPQGQFEVGVGFSAADSIRAWPLARKHPAFGTPEHCRLDLDLAGGFQTDCVQGRLFAVGRVGLLQKRPDEVYETLDAGGSWTRVPLPRGFDSDEIVCSALGCRLGPYFRAGWGEPAPSRAELR